MARKQNFKPSDLSEFAMRVYDASATYMDFDEYFYCYEEVLKLLFFNHDLDLPIMQREETSRDNVIEFNSKRV